MKAAFTKSYPAIFLRTMIRHYFDDQISRTAAELAYSLLFMLFPFILFLNALLGVLHVDIDDIMRATALVIPTEVATLVESYLGYLSGMSTPGLLFTGLALTVMSIFRVVNVLLYALNTVYEVKKIRHWFKQMLLSFAFAVLLTLSFVVILLILFLGQDTLNALSNIWRIPESVTCVWLWLRFVILAAWLFFLLTSLYVVAPNRKLKLRQAMPGAFFAMLAWVAVSLGLSFYVDNFSRYSLLYGSIGAVIVMMLWLFVTGIILQLGGLVNYTIMSVPRRETRMQIQKETRRLRDKA
ncbi:MAG: YihY/virulence factor BrkB family protein [Clostridiaceae bacterium]|nr:YihY/virulence factor BrkB family protein [Clostridiaceae bacterium]